MRISGRGAVLVVLFILALAVGFLGFSGSLTGLVVGDDAASTTIDQVFTETGSVPVHLAGHRQGLSVSGTASGAGDVTITALYGGARSLVGQFHVSGDRSFSDLCDETCTLSFGTDDVVLDVELSGPVQVHLDHASYLRDSVSGSLPLFTGRSTTFTLRPGTATTFALDDYFYDPDEDPLTYVVTADDNLTVELGADSLTITPDSGFFGERQITIFVSDLSHTVRIPLTINVEPVTSFQAASLNSPVEVSTDLLTDLEAKGELDVIVVLKDDGQQLGTTGNLVTGLATASPQEKQEYLSRRKDEVQARSRAVLSGLRTADFKGRGRAGLLASASASESTVDFRPKAIYETVPAFAGRVTASGYRALMADPRVDRIVRDMPVHLLTNQSVPHAGAAIAVNMSLGGRKLNGSGQSVCVIDSGIDDHHPDFGNRILNQSCFCSASDLGNGGCCAGGFTASNSSALDDYGHGTMVTGIIASENATFPGVAPGAGIVAIKAFNSSGDALFSDIGLAVETCISNATIYNITTIQMSFGTNVIGPGGSTFDQGSAGFANADVCDNLSSSVGTVTTSPLNLAAGLGIIPVASTGNDGYVTGISYPSCMSNVTAVSAVNPLDDSIPDFANDVALNDAWAGGVNICAARANQSNNLSGVGGSNCDPPSNIHIIANGTSFAAPHLAGGILLLHQVLETESQPNLTVERVRRLLNQSEVFITDSFNSVVRPRLSVVNMIAYQARNFTLNRTRGSVAKTGVALINYSNPDFTEILSCVSLEPNNVTINQSANCADLNGSGTISILSQSGLTSPRVLNNGQPCDPSQCTNLSYNGSALSFTATGMGSFSTNDAVQTITSCQQLTLADTIFRLNATVQANGTCLTINQSSITLDCQNNLILFDGNGSDSTSGVLVENTDNVTVKNCDIRDINASGIDGVGIRLRNATNSILINDSVQTNGSSRNIGVLLSGGKNLTLSNSTIATSGSDTFNPGVLISNESGTLLLTGLTVSTNATSLSGGVLIHNGTDSLTLTDSIITAKGSGSDNYGVWLSRGIDQALLRSLTITTSSAGRGIGVFVENSSSPSLWHSTIITNGTDDDNHGVELTDGVTGASLFNLTIRTSGTTTNDGVVLSVSSTDANLTNLTISSSGLTNTSGIRLENGSLRATIIDSVIRLFGNTSTIGLLADGATTLINTRIHANASGADNNALRCRGDDLVAVNNTLSTNGTSGNSGVVLLDCADANLTSNTIQSAGTGSSNNGVLQNSSSPRLNLTDNIILTHGLTRDDGVELTSSDNTVLSNTIIANGTGLNEGLRCTSDNNSIINNTITTAGSSANYPLTFQAGCGHTLSSKNTLRTRTTGGNNDQIYIFDGHDLQIIGDIFEGQGSGNDIEIDRGADFLLKDLRFNSSTTQAINIDNANRTNVTNAVFDAPSSWIGIDVDSRNTTFTNTTLQNSFGSVRFFQSLSHNGSVVNMADATFAISSNSIFLDSDNLPTFNASAQLSLTGLTLSAPDMRVDLEDDGSFVSCTAPRCIFVSGTTTNYTFNVSSFTTYTVSNNGSNAVPTASGGGGGQTAHYAYNSIIHKENNDSIFRQPLGTYEAKVVTPEPSTSPPVQTQQPNLPAPTVEEPVTSVAPSVNPICGDGLCERGEDSFTCPQDCGVSPPEPTRQAFPWSSVGFLMLGITVLLLLVLGVLRLVHRSEQKVRDLPTIIGPPKGKPKKNAKGNALVKKAPAKVKPPKSTKKPAKTRAKPVKKAQSAAKLTKNAGNKYIDQIDEILKGLR